MAVCFIMEFGAVDEPAIKYAQVLRDLSRVTKGRPDGLLSHVAGLGPDGMWCAVDVWQTHGHFERFFSDQLEPALKAVGASEPTLRSFDVADVMKHKRWTPPDTVDLTTATKKAAGALSDLIRGRGHDAAEKADGGGAGDDEAAQGGATPAPEVKRRERDTAGKS